MEQRAESGAARILSHGVFRSALFWSAMVIVVFGAWLFRALAAPPAAASAQPGQNAAAPSPEGDVHALARLEPATGLILVGARPGARIEQILVGQGDKVAPGQLLAVLEGHEQALAQTDLAEAQKTRAIHQRELQKRKLKLEREQFDKLQKARLESAGRVLSSKALFDDITSQYKAILPTVQGKERFDLELRYLGLENQNLKDSLEVRSVQIAQELTPRQRELEDSELGEKSPDMDVLDRQVGLARAAVSQTEVHSPGPGQVLEVLAHAGEVGSGALLALGDVSSMSAVAEVFQSDAPKLTVGDPASVRVLDISVPGKVSRIGTMVAKNQLANLDPRALQDRRVVKVVIRLDDASLAARLVNMEVEAVITTGGATSGTAARSGR